MKQRNAVRHFAAVAVVVMSLVASACGSSSNSGSKAASATSLASFGSMNNLVAAAKKEGTLNVTTLQADWANYGTIMKDFTAKYGIKINDENPDGTSQDEINAIKQLKGQSRAPDVFDLGQSFAISGDSQRLLAPYKVQSWDQIPGNLKASDGSWYSSYGGYMAIGYDSSKVKTPPTSFKDLLSPAYKNQVAINGNPTQANAAFSAVYAAALANGGSLGNIDPGIQYFGKLHGAGNFVPVTASTSTVESGQTPIVVWWDYLQESEIASKVPSWKVVIPPDSTYSAYYTQAISKTSPHPAAARLWEEYLYSVEGQNLWLQGSTRPIELNSMLSNHSADQAAYAKLPPAPPGLPAFPSPAQLNDAQNAVNQKWAQTIGG